MRQLSYSKSVNNTIIAEAVKRANNRIVAIGKEYGIDSEPYKLAASILLPENKDMDLLNGMDRTKFAREGSGSRAGMSLFDAKKIQQMSRSDAEDMLRYMEAIETRKSLEDKALQALNISPKASKETKRNAVREYTGQVNSFETAKATFYNMTAHDAGRRQQYVPELYHKGKKWDTYDEYNRATEKMKDFIEHPEKYSSDYMEVDDDAELPFE